jgi:hypothetical protein
VVVICLTALLFILLIGLGYFSNIIRLFIVLAIARSHYCLSSEELLLSVIPIFTPIAPSAKKLSTKIKDNFLIKKNHGDSDPAIYETSIKLKPDMPVQMPEYLDKYSDFSFSARVKIKNKYNKLSCIYL